MTLIRTSSKFALVFAAGCLSAVSALANPIFVANFSFETLPAGFPTGTCGVGCAFSVGAIPSWGSTDLTTEGQFQPGTPGNVSSFTTLSDGPTSAFSNRATLTQTVVPVVQLGVVYTLLVDIGFRNEVSQAFDGTADLFINGVAHTAVGVAPSRGNWATFTTTYTGAGGDVGSAITIRLNSSGAEGNYDNVRLSDNTVTAAIPEPASASILGLGLAGLLVWARRKRA